MATTLQLRWWSQLIRRTLCQLRTKPGYHLTIAPDAVGQRLRKTYMHITSMTKERAFRCFVFEEADFARVFWFINKKQLDLLKMPTKNKTYPPEWFTMVKYANHNHLKQIQANMEDSNMLIGLNGWGFGWARCGGWCFAWWLEAFWRLLFWSFFWGDLYLNNETWKIRIWFGLKLCEGRFFSGVMT